MENLYVAFGSVGSYRGARVWVRVVTDSPAICMLAQTMLLPASPQPYKDNTSKMAPIAVLVTEHAPDIAAVQLIEGDKGAISSATALLGGAHAKSQAALYSAFMHTASQFLLETEGVVSCLLAVYMHTTYARVYVYLRMYVYTCTCMYT